MVWDASYRIHHAQAVSPYGVRTVMSIMDKTTAYKKRSSASSLKAGLAVNQLFPSPVVYFLLKMTISTSSLDPSRRFFILSLQRTTSNLLVRILGLDQQPNVHWNYNGSCVFLQTRLLMRSLGLSNRPVTEWTAKEKSQVTESFQDSFNALEKYVTQGEAEGKVVFAKEHCNYIDDPSFDLNTKGFTVQLPDRYANTKSEVSVQNRTVLPNIFLRSWTPIFLIRHPVRLFPSLCRALLEVRKSQMSDVGLDYFLCDMQSQMSLVGTRRLYDWYASDLLAKEHASDPILLDSDDVINETGVTEQLVRLVGLDLAKMKRSWTPAQEAELAQVSGSDKVFLETLMTSSGIQKSKAAGDVNIDEEALRWRAEFEIGRAHV